MKKENINIRLMKAEDYDAVFLGVGLGGVNANVGGDRCDLRRDEIGLEQLDRRDAARVLNGEQCQCGGAVHTESLKRLEVGLDSSASAGI